MNCENEFCIYQHNGNCIVKNISIDSFGHCADCTYPSIDKKQLLDLKRTLLEKLENTDKAVAVQLNSKN